MAYFSRLCAIFKDRVLKEEECRGLLGEESCAALMKTDVDLDSTDLSVDQLDELNPYPKHPLYIEITKRLAQWMESGQPPYLQLSKFHLLDESHAPDSRDETTQNVSCLLSSLKKSWDATTDDEKAAQTSRVIACLGRRGLLDLLGVRQTVGSVDVFPPAVGTLMKTFNSKHKPHANLSVGARALSKHCHRDRNNKWWGDCSGSERAKNEHANTILMKLLADAAWINLHALPHGVKVLEVRCSEGYGARWSCDGTEFRGFLEPQMTDGHAVGWLH